jgi:Delta3-Delta2-enoyl-CoA isomerase
MAEPTLTRDGEIFIINYGADDNVTSAAWAASMNVLLDQVESAAGPKVLVTTGSGKHYSNGLDVPFMATANPDQLRAYLYDVMGVLRRIMLFPAPTAAAVNGHAFGMGAFLAIAHDQSVMRKDRGFVCFPEVHLGMSFPPSLMSVIDATLTPQTRRYALATGYRYSAIEAEGAGIVTASVPAEEVLATAIAMARPHAATAGANLGVIKQQLFPDVVKYLAPEK